MRVGKTLKQAFKLAFVPSEGWGPALAENREEWVVYKDLKLTEKHDKATRHSKSTQCICSCWGGYDY